MNFCTSFRLFSYHYDNKTRYGAFFCLDNTRPFLINDPAIWRKAANDAQLKFVLNFRFFSIIFPNILRFLLKMHKNLHKKKKKC